MPNNGSKIEAKNNTRIISVRNTSKQRDKPLEISSRVLNESGKVSNPTERFGCYDSRRISDLIIKAEKRV